MTVPGRRVVVLDYGSGNLRSAERALAATGSSVTVTADRRAALEADGLVVPGVGAFAACMDGLRAVGGDEIIAERVAHDRPVLGICVGHQVLFSAGVEHGERTPGCGRWPGVVEQLRSTRLPHMGWNTVDVTPGSRLFADVEDERFYFVHSYGVRAAADDRPDAALSWTEHDGDTVLAAVEDGPLSSTQFHPEKSGAAGARLLRNWVATL
ncbi:glutamine amidotransferase [Friedmanniella endophytica]|uniref:Imidazole glycerol phosphate synthase subunit HisH n=1 Tax=Microlunatus kandeliicorticis TaxID=1759536 RepID=A0A7W3P6N6_9ACTN|nr:imidazole glycerol phosphate synthase subunit HisH [Microlunatus kandeliicorticis]MBA8795164.1 glutamine amidotransferase [Microlunatus kandeliicorticis]